MKRKLTLLVILLGVAGTASATHQYSPNPADWFDGTWTAPSEDAIPNDATGDMIRYGKQLLTETYKHFGAESDMPYQGNKLSCSNCHLDEGTAALGTPWAVVWYKYGAGGQGPYSARSDRFLDMKNRIHDCMLRSMDGLQLPDNSYELASMVEYMKWLSTGMQISDWTKVVGQTTMSVPALTRPADPVHGKEVYVENCAACHQLNGGGVWDANAQKFVYPAVWGPASYNTGAGMYRIRTGVGFVRGNMPYGHANPTDSTSLLSVEDAWDVTAYVNSQPRPVWSGYLTDWSKFRPSDCMPNWLLKTVDAAYDNYFPRVEPDGKLSGDTSYPQKYTADAHKYGPWQAMLTEQSDMQKAYLAISPRPTYPECREFAYDPATKTGALRN
jgi:thiosulfate dehydrogenase